MTYGSPGTAVVRCQPASGPRLEWPQRGATQLFKAGLVERMLATLQAKPTAPVASSGAGLVAWQMRRVALHIEMHLETALAVQHLAGLVTLSSSYFFRAFKRSFGESPHAYVMRRRIDRAQDMMLSTTNSLSDIALACGLSDQAHLSRLFRRMVGETPARWRRIHRHAT